MLFDAVVVFCTSSGNSGGGGRTVASHNVSFTNIIQMVMSKRYAKTKSHVR